ncbi:MAG: energy transducer TonB [Candidatus Kapabacteria bacterium]|nr:energy transducer TonB [Candidatus Kapabacteria bacterium]
MSTTVTAQQPFEQLRYGAAELKQIIQDNTRKAFLVTLAILLLIAIYTFVAPIVEEWIYPAPKIVKVKLSRVSLDNLPPPQSQNDEPPPPPPPANTPTGPAARAGTPVAVPDAELAPDAKDFANMDEINRASAEGGSGEDNGNFASNIGDGVVIASREEEPNIEDFTSVEKEPSYDEAALARRVKYPEMARRNNIEGIVLVGALIGKDGKIEKLQVIESDNEILEAAAVNAVRETSFTPAQQNGQTVRVWARVPIRFTLR